MLQGFLFHFEKPFCRNCLFLGFNLTDRMGNDTEPTIQERLFREIKLKVKEDNSFVHTIAELLHVSYDSAYRRIRGEKIISVDELYKLSKAFDISIDSLFEVKSGKTVFNSVSIEPGKITLKQWLEGILLNLQVLQADQTSQIIYAAKDAPFFHYFHIPELAAFKMFFWEKTLFRFPGFENKPFNLADTDDELQAIGKKILLAYTKINVTEIWNEDTFYIILRQLEYYYVAGFFKNKDDLDTLFDKLGLWIRHLEQQAEFGFQYYYGIPPNGVPGSFKLFENEVVLNDNTVLMKTGEARMSFLTYNVINLLTTQDPDFCDKIEFFLDGVLQKSTLISSSAAKARKRFFNQLINQVERFRVKLASIDPQQE